MAQVFQLKRTVSQDGQMRIEVVYGITSLPPQRAPAARLLQLVRRHWAIGAIRFAEMSEKLRDGEQGGESP